MNMWDFFLAGLIWVIDINPLWDLIFVPLAWAMVFFTG